MKKQRVFVTGATGGMGFASLKEMLKDTDKQDIVILARDSARAMKNLCAFYHDGDLPEEFWGHIYNIGGGNKKYLL